MAADYPIFLNVRGKLAVVVGGGKVAARKVAKLLEAGASVRVVSPEMSAAIESLAGGESGGRKAALELVRDAFEPKYLDGALLAFACTDNACVNGSVATAARDAGVPVNIADDPDGCDFTVPAVSTKGAVRIAIATGGGSPALSRFVREWLDENLPEEIGVLGEELARARPIVMKRVSNPEHRQAIWDELCTDCSIKLLAQHDRETWRQWFERTLARYAD